MKTPLAQIFIALAIGLPLSAGTIVVGQPADTATGDCIPFGCDYSVPGFGAEYQQVYTSGLFSGPITITGLEFFNTQFDSGATALTGTFNIFLSTTAADWNTLNSTPADNIGANNTEVFSGSLAQTWSFGDTLTIPLSAPFTYTPGPGANLLLDVTETGAGAGGLVFFDVNGSTGVNLPGSDTIFGIDYPTIHDFPHQLVFSGEGLVTGFETTSLGTPEPESFALFAVGLACVGAVFARRRATESEPGKMPAGSANQAGTGSGRSPAVA